jgi:hypothetical protein
MWKTELYVIVMSAESLTQGSTSVNDSVTPFSVKVNLSAPNAAEALSRSAQPPRRGVSGNAACCDLHLASVSPHYLLPEGYQSSPLGTAVASSIVTLLSPQ